MDQKIKNILDFWFVKTPSEKRFKKDPKFDNLIKEKFLKDYELAITNKLDDWQESKEGCLALIVLIDQFSRNLFRENKKAFEFDFKAREILNKIIEKNYLEKMNNSEKFFSLLPFIHSEDINDHEKLYKLMDQYLKDHPGIKDIKKFWTDHTKTIKKFSHYPHRNKVLGRKSTSEEIEFLKQSNSSW